MQRQISFFKLAFVFCSAGIVGCSNHGTGTDRDREDTFLFSVLDVGQGLSQAGIRGDSAVFWDMGDRGAHELWCKGYTDMGSPYIAAIVISHGDMDHLGGLTVLSAQTRFSGRVVVGPYEDTATIRAAAQGWSPAIRFETVKQGDTLVIWEGVRIECIWPPADPSQLKSPSDTGGNESSLCFRIEHGWNTVCITGDIDSSAAGRIAVNRTFGLESDIVVVPHHGSAGSFNALFYGYVNPAHAIISCALRNTYGHPSEVVVKFLALQLGAAVHETRYQGTVAARSNGQYWVWISGS
jgi:competence protein ComEC